MLLCVNQETGSENTQNSIIVSLRYMLFHHSRLVFLEGANKAYSIWQECIGYSVLNHIQI